MHSLRTYCYMTFLSILFCSNIYASHCIELAESVFPIYLLNGGKYKVFDDSDATGQFILEWKICTTDLLDRYFFTIRSNDTSVRLYGQCGEILDVQLFNGFNITEPITLFNLQNFYLAAIPVQSENNSTIMRYPIQVTIPYHQLVSPGSYKCFLEVGLYACDAVLINTQTVQLQIEVDATQNILIKLQEGSSPQSSATLDFGEVSSSITKSIFLHVQSNIHYALTAMSLNGSKLNLTPNWNHSFYRCSSIPYDCCCNGVKMILQKMPQQIVSGCSTPSSQGVCHHFSISLYPNPKQNWEGVYEDEILFSLQSVY